MVESFGHPFLWPVSTGILPDSRQQSKTILKPINKRRKKLNIVLEFKFGNTQMKFERVGFYP